MKITDLRSDNGLVILELLDHNQKVVNKIGKAIEDRKCTIVFDGLNNGKYAIRFIHDENSNGELDTNWLGMPQEGYGFSNDAFGFFGPKNFDEWLFDLNGNMEMVLKVAY